MASSGGSSNPVRERIDGKILPPVVSNDWDVDSGTQASTKASGVTIHPNIDPKGEYKAPLVLPARRLLPAEVTMAAQALLLRAPLLMDVPDPLDLLILQGDMSVHHQRSPEEPPAHFLEGEEVDEDEGDVPPNYVTEGNVATLGLADNGGAGAEPNFSPALEPHVPATRPAKQ